LPFCVKWNVKVIDCVCPFGAVRVNVAFQLPVRSVPCAAVAAGARARATRAMAAKIFIEGVNDLSRTKVPWSNWRRDWGRHFGAPMALPGMTGV
jgi:hypothetical protein